MLASGTGGGNTNQTTANSSSQSQQHSQEGEISLVKLRPDDYRQGTRSKHIDSVSVNQQGFIAGGTNSGEIYLWQVNFHNIRQKKAEELYKWINSFKVHKKSNHYMQFSPDGKMLLSGSADGTASIWDVRFPELSQKSPDKGNLKDDVQHLIGQKNERKNLQASTKSIQISDEQLIFRFEDAEYRKNASKYECQIDGIEWSLTGRYAYCAISVKELQPEEEKSAATNSQRRENQKPAIVKIHVYDTYTKRVIENLDKACRLGKDIKNYACILKKHPVKDNILLGCFDGGISVLYDVDRRQIIQRIDELGIYSIDQFTMNNAVDVDFSADG